MFVLAKKNVLFVIQHWENSVVHCAGSVFWLNVDTPKLTYWTSFRSHLLKPWTVFVRRITLTNEKIGSHRWDCLCTHCSCAVYCFFADGKTNKTPIIRQVSLTIHLHNDIRNVHAYKNTFDRCNKTNIKHDPSSIPADYVIWDPL